MLSRPKVSTRFWRPNCDLVTKWCQNSHKAPNLIRMKYSVLCRELKKSKLPAANTTLNWTNLPPHHIHLCPNIHFLHHRMFICRIVPILWNHKWTTVFQSELLWFYSKWEPLLSPIMWNKSSVVGQPKFHNGLHDSIKKQKTSWFWYYKGW